MLSYCKYDNDDNYFVFPEVEVFLRYKYVIATCAMAANLKNYGIPAGHFNVVFVDEAGRCVRMLLFMLNDASMFRYLLWPTLRTSHGAGSYQQLRQSHRLLSVLTATDSRRRSQAVRSDR